MLNTIWKRLAQTRSANHKPKPKPIMCGAMCPNLIPARICTAVAGHPGLHKNGDDPTTVMTWDDGGRFTVNNFSTVSHGRPAAGGSILGGAVRIVRTRVSRNVIINGVSVGFASGITIDEEEEP